VLNRPTHRHGGRRRALPWRGGVGALVVLVSSAPLALVATAPPAGAAAQDPLVSTVMAELDGAGTPIVPTATTTLAAGDQLVVTFDQSVTVPATWSIELADGSATAALDGSDSSVSQPSSSSLDFTLAGGPVVGMAAADLEVLSSQGITSTGGQPWNLVVSGEVSKLDSSGASTATCVDVPDTTRVFGGSNCDLGFVVPGSPTPPDVFDIIAVPTTDLDGPPLDSAPEVITNCTGGSTDTVYDLGDTEVLGSAPCGTAPQGESALGNTNGPSLDYIPTPTLASFEQVGVIETVPGSSYVSATAVPPQLTGIQVSGDEATFDYDTPVTCQDQTGGATTVAQFTYASPWWATDWDSDLTYPSSITCPDPAGATSVTVTYPQAIPGSVRFKFEGYGDGSFIVAGTDSPFDGEREASESAYVGTTALPPAPSITGALVLDPTAGQITSAGGTFTLDYTAADATQCALSGQNGTSVALQYRDSPPSGSAPSYSFTAPATEAEVPCPDGSGVAQVTLPANTSTLSPASYTFTLTAAGLAASDEDPASSSLTLTVPAATVPPSTPPATVATPPAPALSTPAPAASTTTTTTPPAPVVVVAPFRPDVLSLVPSVTRPAGRVWVRIRGRHFAKHDTVRFGTKLALGVREVSPTLLLALCPPGTGRVEVTVHTATGTSLRVRAAGFRY
jgi:hypothetical protein